MTNEEKKQFILDVHSLFMEQRPYDGDMTSIETKIKDDIYWESFSKQFLDKIPSKLYKYREIKECNFDSIDQDYAWFSKTSEFGDIIDFTINTNIELELEEFKNNPQEHIKRISTAIINYWLSSYGITVDEKMLNLALPLFNGDGEISKEKAADFLSKYLPLDASEENAIKLSEATKISNQEPIYDGLRGYFNHYLGFNKRIREGTFSFCLAEESDNLAMWETYAKGETGFCIEYEISKDSFVGQRVLTNLFPIFYGEKEHIKFFDVFIRSLSGDKKINGISYEDYEKWFISSYTKDPSFSFQKEWRVVFTKEMGGSKQPFPFAKSIILGQRISEENKSKLMEIAKRKGLEVYQRKLNVSGSKVVLVKL